MRHSATIPLLGHGPAGGAMSGVNYPGPNWESRPDQAATLWSERVWVTDGVLHEVWWDTQDAGNPGYAYRISGDQINESGSLNATSLAEAITEYEELIDNFRNPNRRERMFTYTLGVTILADITVEADSRDAAEKMVIGLTSVDYDHESIEALEVTIDRIDSNAPTCSEKGGNA